MLLFVSRFRSLFTLHSAVGPRTPSDPSEALPLGLQQTLLRATMEVSFGGKDIAWYFVENCLNWKWVIAFSSNWVLALQLIVDQTLRAML